VTGPTWYRPKRLASSVRLPWFLGVVSLLGLVVATAILGGRVDSGVIVPTAVLDAQQASTDSAAQQIRRSLNAGLQDLDQLSGNLGLAEKPGDLEPYLKDFAGRYKRYRSVYLVDGGRKVTARTGGEPHLDPVPDKIQEPGMTNALKIDSVPVVVQYAPVHLRDKRVVTIAAEYDVSYLRSALDGVRPNTVWVVNRDGQVIASTSGFTAFQQLDGADLRRAATSAHDASGVATVGGSQSAKDIVAHAPVHGEGAASALGWGVVTSRNVNTVALPQTQARRQALLFSLVLGALTVIIFSWLMVVFLRPLRELVREAERLAGGDLSEPVEVRRYDEIGLVGRALERMRVRVIREATQHRQPPRPPPPPPQAPQSPVPVSPDFFPTAPHRQVVSSAPWPVRQKWSE
jgi:HAMP domain-containing protein